MAVKATAKFDHGRVFDTGLETVHEKSNGEMMGSGEKRNNPSNRTTSIKKMVNGSLINQIVNHTHEKLVSSHIKVGSIVKQVHSGHKSSSVHSTKDRLGKSSFTSAAHQMLNHSDSKK